MEAKILDDIMQDFRDFIVAIYSEIEVDWRKARVGGRRHEAAQLEAKLLRDERAYVAAVSGEPLDLATLEIAPLWGDFRSRK